MMVRKNHWQIVGLLAVALLAGSPVWAGNLVKNGDFSQGGGDKPAGWSVVETEQKVSTEKPEGKPGALKVEITKDGGKNLGEIRQTIKVQKNTKYRLTAEMKSSKEGLGLIMIKPRSGDRKELDRINVGSSKTEWGKVSKDFDSGEAVEVQVLCRFVQKSTMVGGSCLFTNIELTALDAAGNPVEGAAPKASEPKKETKTGEGAVAMKVAKAGADQYVLPKAAGDGSGKDLANARGMEGLQAAIDAAGPGNTVYIGSGTYEKAAMSLSAGGSGPESMVTIAGKDTGGGLPVFKSDFDKARPDKSGKLLINIKEGVSYVAIRDLKLDGHSSAVRFRGSNKGVRIENVDTLRGRDMFWIEGTGEDSITDLVVKDCDVKYYTKRAFRIFGGVSNAQFINCHADAGGKEWGVENFPMGFQVSVKGNEISDHDITFTDCSASGNYQGPDNGAKGYWNADGFCSESRSRNLTWIRCAAFNNTDGGWDIKSTNPKWVDCIGVGNKRNFRVWTGKGEEGATYENCLSAFAYDYGNLGHHVGFWILAGGDVKLIRCTAWGDPLSLKVEGKDPAKKTVLTLDHSLLYSAEAGKGISLFEGTEVKDTGSVVRKDASVKAELRKPVKDWRGGDNAFDCVSQPGVGYQFKAPQVK